MARLVGGYQGAKSCTSGPQPGAWGQMDWYLTNYAKLGGVNSGIYNCRSVRGGRTTSLHGEGRASDNGVRPYSAEYGTKLANAIVNNSRALGVQCVIWNRKIWSSSYPDTWRAYKGVAHHRDHLHVEFTWASAKRDRKAQRELWAKILGGGAGGGTGSSGSGNRYGDPKAEHKLGSRTLDLYSAGTDVTDLQQRLKKLSRYDSGEVDGYYGPAVKSAITRYQRSRGLKADGIAGPKTIDALLSGAKKVASDLPVKEGKVGSKAPKFPLPKGHWMGEESNNPKNHSGALKKDQPHVRQLQQGLRDRNWKIGVDGLYGAETERIVRAFQRKAGLTVDGYAGRETWDAIFNKPLMKK